MSRKMKDSGIEWIGEIPEEWEKSRLKDYYRFEKGKNAALYTQEYLGENPGPYPVYSGQTENDGVMGLINSYDYDINECLFTTTVGAKVMSPKILKNKFSLSQNCLIMINTKGCDNRFFYYSLFPLFEYERSLIPTYMQPSLRISDLNRYQFFIPNISEQQTIANFLDQKVSEIDHILEKTKESIEEYKKYKQSIITEAVTKGLNPDVEMKDSGIEWIGEIPKHWKVSKLKYYTNIIMGQSPKSEDYNTDGVGTPFLQGNADFTDMYPLESVYTIRANKYCEKGDILFSVRAPVGAKNIANKTYAIGRGLCAIRSIDIANDFLWRLIDLIKIEFLFISRGSTYDSVTISDVQNALITIPPEEEQQLIANYLNKKSTEIDSLISQKEQLLSDLDSYKKSLIYECVTGKRMVQ